MVGALSKLNRAARRPAPRPASRQWLLPPALFVAVVRPRSARVQGRSHSRKHVTFTMALNDEVVDVLGSLVLTSVQFGSCAPHAVASKRHPSAVEKKCFMGAALFVGDVAAREPTGSS